MMDTRRQAIIRRLMVLRNLEFFNIFWLPICLVVALTSRNVLHWQPYAYGMFLICAVLAQGVFLLAPKTSNHLQNRNNFPRLFLCALFVFQMGRCGPVVNLSNVNFL
jgi:bacteriorhodopsin